MLLEINIQLVEKQEPLAQLVEHLTFNQRVAGSSPARLICESSSVVEHHLAKVGVASSNLVFRL